MKKWAKFLCCFALLGAFLVGGLAGCGTVSNIKNNSTELIYNGNAAALVKTDKGNFLYFANAYSSAPTNKDEYASAKKISYLARVNNGNLEAKNPYFSPKKVENVREEVAGYDGSFMFVLGQNIYYAIPNTDKIVSKTEEGQEDEQYHFDYTRFLKSSLDGSGKKELYTTLGELKEVEVLKNGKTYYLVLLAGDRLVTINLSNDKAQTLATGVTSVALPETYRESVSGSTLNWNGQIYFTTARNDEHGSGNTSNVVKSIPVSSTNPEKDTKVVYNKNNATLVARERDVVFFTDKVGQQQTALYMVDLTNLDEFNAFGTESPRRSTVYAANSVETSTGSDFDLHLVTSNNGKVQGYIFKADSQFRFLTTNGKKGIFTFSEDMSSATILFVQERTVFLATSTGLFRADLSKIFTGEKTVAECVQFADMTGISNDAPTAFDGEYLYFYATLQTIPDEYKDQNAEESEEETEETDANIYLHRARVYDINKFQLLGKTTIESRRTK